jgi:hypothetical protein
MAVAYVIPSLFDEALISLVVSIFFIKVIKAFRSPFDIVRDSIKVIISPGESFKSKIPCGVNIPWLWILDALGETESEFEPA